MNLCLEDNSSVLANKKHLTSFVPLQQKTKIRKSYKKHKETSKSTTRMVYTE